MQDINNLSFNEIVKYVDAQEKEAQGLSAFKISILANITVDLMLPYIKFLCYQEKLRPQIDTGNYDNVLQDASGITGTFDYAKSDLVIVCLHPRILAKNLYFGFPGLSADEVNAEISACLGYIEQVLKEIRKKTAAAVLLHNFQVPDYPAFGILDYQDSAKQLNIFRKINQEILRVAKKFEGVYIIDVDLLQSRLGSARLNDERFWHMARAPYSRDGYLELAKEYIKFIRALRAKTKKCLVLDCDNTLWGGIIGEDGFEGIKISHTYPGSSYREFQEAVLDLYKRGVLLALCSRNNQADVEEVLEKHPDMILRKEHFVAIKINWKDKVSNLKEIAQELDIGLDSLVFVDDSEFEINMVREMLPEAGVFLLPKEPSGFRRALEDKGFFDSLSFSEEDKLRSRMYQEEAKRKEVKAQFEATNIEEYLKFLEMKLTIARPDSLQMSRVAQLIQRTNQFNLTAKRYAESEISGLAKKGDVFCVSLSDRFGDSGIVGAAIVLYEGKEAFIEVFLMSCRVIGRGIEEAMLKVCIDEARQRDCENIFGYYVPTNKNRQVENFYTNHHFSKVNAEDGKVNYVFSLSKAAMPFPAYFKLIKVGDVEHIL